MTIYADNGYLSYKGIKDIGQKYIYIIGGRGIGKSHLVCDIINDNNKPILYVRRSNVDLSNSFSKMSDFGKDDWFGKDVCYEYSEKKGVGMAFLDKDHQVARKPFAIGVSLSTFNNKTGIDFTQFNDVVFDEFIPQRGARPIKHEFAAYKNIMEAVYRNRDHMERITAWFFGNSNAIMSNILIGYRLIPECYKMVKNKIEVMQIIRCAATIIMPFASPISKEKNENDFYKYLPKSRKRMEIYNEFADMEDDRVRHQNLKEYIHDMRTPLFSVWQHKAEFKFYITKPMKAHCDDVFDNNQSSLERWQTTTKKYMKQLFLNGDITFSDYETQCDFLASWDCESWNDILA